MGSLPEPTNTELERCDSCGQLADALCELEGDRLCDRCDAVFWTAQVLTKAGIADEAEIIATLAFAAHRKYESLRDEKSRAAFSRDFARKYPSFELIRFVEDVPTIRPRKVDVEVLRYTGSELPRAIRLRILSKFVRSDEVAELYQYAVEQEELPVATDSRGSISWQHEGRYLVVDVGPREEIPATRLEGFDKYPQVLRFSFPVGSVVAAICQALIGSPLRPGSKREDEMFAVGLGDHGRPKTKTAKTLIPACVAWHIGERYAEVKPEGRRLKPRERRPRVAKMLNRHLFYSHRLEDNPYSSADSVWEDAKEVGPRFNLAVYLLQSDTRF
jgi:hypothetical protein